MVEMIGGKEPEGVSAEGRIVVTGFEPFDGRTRNRSWDLVQKLRGAPGRDVFRLPVDFGQLSEVVPGILSRRPRVVLMIGESPTNQLRVEQVALNMADSDDPDNAGRIPQCEPLIVGAPLALKTSWDARRVAGRLHQEGIPATVSFHAGTFACNAALYLALQGGRGSESSVTETEGGGELISRGSERIGPPAVGFLHVPNSRGPSGLGAANLVRAVELGIEELLSRNPA